MTTTFVSSSSSSVVSNNLDNYYNNDDERQSLSIENGDENNNNNNNSNDNDDNNSNNNTIIMKARYEQIMDIIETIPDRTIRPGRLAAELGLSIDDASAELCGLLAAVGSGATFHFENTKVSTSTTGGCVDGTKKLNKPIVTMVFTFPQDFRRRAIMYRTKQSRYKQVIAISKVGIKIIKIITAFGLLLSLLIVSVVVLISLIAALVAAARVGCHTDRRFQNSIVYQIRYIVSTFRQLLWCYALFGPSLSTTNNSDTTGNQQDPFLREVAYDLWLFLTVFCGNPGSIFFWFYANQLNYRRHRQRNIYQGWYTNYRNNSTNNNNVPNEIIPGVTIVPRDPADPNGDRYNSSSSSSSLPLSSSSHAQGEHRGLLSVAVEFLFGPTQTVPGPSTEQISRLRAAVILHISTSTSSSNSGVGGVSLTDLAPYIDSPPPISLNDSVNYTNLDDSAISTITSQGLLIVSYFNGVPVAPTCNDDTPVTESSSTSQMVNAKFIFPELLAESTVVTRYDYQPESDDGTWNSFLFHAESTIAATSTNTGRTISGGRIVGGRSLSSKLTKSSSLSSSSVPLPKYLVEERYKFTKLSKQQLIHCIVLGILNIIGVYGSYQSISPGGIIDVSRNQLLNILLRSLLYPVLKFYSLLFFTIPLCRLVILWRINLLRQHRNKQRSTLAQLQERI